MGNLITSSYVCNILSFCMFLTLHVISLKLTDNMEFEQGS